MINDLDKMIAEWTPKLILQC